MLADDRVPCQRVRWGLPASILGVLANLTMASGLVVAVASCAVAPKPASNALIDRVLAANAAEHGIPAQAVVVLRNGEPIYRGFSGHTTIEADVPVDAGTVFHTLSVSKLFASTLLLQLADQGQVDLTAPASRYLDDLPPAWRAITVEQFLSHVSGVPEYFDTANLSKSFPSSLRAVFGQLAEQPLVDPPGTRTRYTQTNYLVVGAILEAVTKARYEDLVRDRIIAPLGLRNTWFGREQVPRHRLAAEYHGEAGRIVPDATIHWPAYSATHTGIYSRADDMATFLAAVADGRFVSRQALPRLWKPYAFANGNTGFFAAGWDYARPGAWHELGHDGGAKLRVRLLFRDDFNDHVVIVYFTNGSRDNVWSRTLVDSVQRVVLPR